MKLSLGLLKYMLSVKCWAKNQKLCKDGKSILMKQLTPINANNFTDLNDVTDTGVYSYDKLSSAMTNAPFTGTYFSGTLRVTYYQSGKILQEFIAEDGKSFSRHKWNGTWTSWLPVANRIQDAVQGNTSKTFDLTNKYPCLVSVGRNSTSGTGRLAFIDGWGGLVNLVTHASFDLSMSNGVLTVQNNGASYASVLIVHC